MDSGPRMRSRVLVFGRRLSWRGRRRMRMMMRNKEVERQITTYGWRSWRVVCSSHVGKCYHDVDYGMNSDHRAYQASISTMLNYTKSATQPILYNNTESDGPIFSLAGMTGFEEYKVSSLPWKETLPLVYTEDWWARKCWIHVHTCSGTLGVNQKWNN